MTGGHLGVARTQAQVRRRAYWVNWKADVQHEVKGCNRCAQYFRGAPPRQAILRPILVGELWKRIAINITGKHPKSRNGNDYMLTVMDHFSKLAEAYPLRDHKAPTVAKVLVEQLFSRFGMPYQLQSDQGPDFGTDLFLEMCRWMDIDKIRTSPYRPASNWMVKCYHRTLNSMLGKIVKIRETGIRGSNL